MPKNEKKSKKNGSISEENVILNKIKDEFPQNVQKTVTEVAVGGQASYPVPTTGPRDEFMTSTNLLKAGRKLPKKQKDFSRLVQVYNRELEKDPTKRTPRGVSALHYDIMKKAHELTELEYKVSSIPKCPKCGAKQVVECNKCGTNLETEVVDPALLNARTKGTLKFLDKIAPNLAALQKSYDIKLTMETMAMSFANIILKYVEPENQANAVQELEAEMMKGGVNTIIDAEFSEEGEYGQN